MSQPMQSPAPKARSSAGAGVRLRKMLADNWDWLLILSCIPLLAHKTAFNAPVIVMTGIGLVRLVRNPRDALADPAVRLMTGLFVCFLIPMLASLPDAANLGRSAGTALGDVRYWFMGLFVIETLRRDEARRRLLLGTGIIVGAWCVDAMIQFAVGRNLLGFPLAEDRITGIFYPKFRLGAVTATFAPVAFEFIRRYGPRRKWLWLLLPVVIAAVLLQGSRTGWMMLGVALAAYGSYVLFGAGARHRRRSVAVVTLAGVIALGLASTTDTFRERVAMTTGLFGSFEAADAATSYRLSIWRAGLRMFADHPVNGVGPRSFRYLYQEYSSPTNYFTALGYTPTHPHSFVLEIGIETGLIGMLGYLLGWLLLIRHVSRYPPPLRGPAVPWLLAALVAWFPLNVHMALYASYWSTVAWLTLLVAIGALGGPRSESSAFGHHGHEAKEQTGDAGWPQS